MQLSADQVKALRAPFAPKRVKFRVLSLKTRDPQGRVQLARYVTVDDMTDRLDEVIPGQWSNIFDVTRFDGRGVPVEAKAAILIGDIRREALGATAPDNYDQAMQAKSVDSDGFKRAAYRLGVASYLRTLRPCWFRIAGKAPTAAELVELRKEYAELVGMTVDGDPLDLLSADDFDDDGEGEASTWSDGAGDQNVDDERQPAAKTTRQPAQASTQASTPAPAQAASSSTGGPVEPAKSARPDQPDMTRPEFIAALDKLGLNPKEALDQLGVKSMAGLNLREALETVKRLAGGHRTPRDPKPEREGPPMLKSDRITSGTIQALKADVERQGRDWRDVCEGIPKLLKSHHTVNMVTYEELPLVRSWLGLDDAAQGDDALEFIEQGAASPA